MRNIQGVAVGVLAALVAAQAAYARQDQRQRSSLTREPRYACSTMVPSGTADSRLAQLARITGSTAASAATVSVPGRVTSVQLEEENGCLAYSVEINGSDGKRHDVKVDAGSGRVMQVEIASAGPGMEHENLQEGAVGESAD
jgi:uncharacterized membrane protein YkoI